MPPSARDLGSRCFVDPGRGLSVEGGAEDLCVLVDVHVDDLEPAEADDVDAAVAVGLPAVGEAGVGVPTGGHGGVVGPAGHGDVGDGERKVGQDAANALQPGEDGGGVVAFPAERMLAGKVVVDVGGEVVGEGGVVVVVDPVKAAGDVVPDDGVVGRDRRHGCALTRERGPDAVSLREVQRRAGVSSAAAYRHYRDREALLFAVGQHASVLLADHIQAALDNVPKPGPDPARHGPEASRLVVARLRAGITAYLDFMRAEPGLFRAVFLTGEAPEDLTNPDPASRGVGGRGPYQLLQDCLDDLVAVGVLPEPDAPWSDVAVWAATHGLAVLMLDGPLRFLDDGQAHAATERLIDVILAGLAHPSPDSADG
jgi:AcrR family transcriptional regulator